jgi:hypothetical protein
MKKFAYLKKPRDREVRDDAEDQPVATAADNIGGEDPCGAQEVDAADEQQKEENTGWSILPRSSSSSVP